MNVWGLNFSGTVLGTFGVTVFLGATAALLTKTLSLKPQLPQVALEGVVVTIEEAIAGSAPEHVARILPFIGSLWIYLCIANLLGLVPGLHSPTRDLSATAALAVLVLCSTHWFGIREQGLRRYIQHYLAPTPFLLPFHLLSEITRTIALAVRLFGNIMSLEMAALLVLLVAGFLVPVPLLLLHVIEGLVQAYIFGMLALIYVAGALQHQKIKQQVGSAHE